MSDLSPLGVAPGSSVNITIFGSQLEGATELWTTASGKSSLADGIENNGQEAAKAAFAVTIPADAALGIHGVRVTTSRGVSRLRPFLVDDLPTVQKAGGNSSRESAQAIELPCAVEGRVDNLTRDFYRFQAQAGQRLSFEVWGRRLGSPLDPALFLYRGDGRELNYSDDAEGLSGDPQFVQTFDESGDYLLEVRDIQYRGGGQHFYRLRIGDFPCVNVPLPLAIEAGATTRIDFAGISVEDAAPAELTIPVDYPFDFAPVKSRRSSGQHHAFSQVIVSRKPEFLEREPNDTPEQANVVPFGHSLNGRFDKPRDTDRFTVMADKGDSLVLAGQTRQWGSPTDLVIRVLKPDGGLLAEVDDTGTDEGVLNVTFPEAGRYTIELSDLHRRGGPQYAYRVDVQRTAEQLHLTASTDQLNIPLGGVAPVVVTASRSNHGGITLALEGLPDGVIVHPTVIGPGLSTAVLTLELAADAPAGQMTAARIVGAFSVGDQTHEVTASVRDVLRPDWNNSLLVPGPLAQSVAISAAPAGKMRLSSDPAELTLPRGQRATFTVTAQRGEGIDEAIALATDPEKGAWPKGVSLELKGIDKEQTSVTLELVAAADAALGRYSVAFSGTHKKGSGTVTVYAPSITYLITE